VSDHCFEQEFGLQEHSCSIG